MVVQISFPLSDEKLWEKTNSSSVDGINEWLNNDGRLLSDRRLDLSMTHVSFALFLSQYLNGADCLCASFRVRRDATEISFIDSSFSLENSRVFSSIMSDEMLDEQCRHTEFVRLRDAVRVPVNDNSFFTVCV